MVNSRELKYYIEVINWTFQNLTFDLMLHNELPLSMLTDVPVTL